MVNSDNPSNDHVTLRSCYSLHKTSQKPNHRRNTLSSVRFFKNLHSGQRAHRQERLPPIYLPMEASPKNTFPHASISGPVLKFMHRHMVGRETLFGHTPPLASASSADEPIHPPHELCYRRKSPHFSLFLSVHCFYFFLSPESPFFFVFFEALRHLHDLRSCFC